TRFSRDWSSDVCSSDLEEVLREQDRPEDGDVGEEAQPDALQGVRGHPVSGVVALGLLELVVHEAGEAQREQDQDDAHDDLAHLVLGGQQREQHRGERPGDHGAEHARVDVPGDVGDQDAGEGAHEELALDADVDHAGALADDAGERPEDERQRQEYGPGEDRLGPEDHARFGDRPREQADDEGDEGDRRGELEQPPREPDEHPRPAGEDDHGHGDDGGAAGHLPARVGEGPVEGDHGLAVAPEEGQRARPEEEADDAVDEARLRVADDGALVDVPVGAVGGGLRVRCHGAHQPFASRVTMPPRGARSRRIALTRAGAAMNSTIVACSRVDMSTGTSGWADRAPALSAPNRSAAATMPPGLARPSRATVMPSKPYSSAVLVVMPVEPTPRARAAPARPARPPAVAMVVV